MFICYNKQNIYKEYDNLKTKYYEALGVEYGADLKLIKNAYRKLAKLYHPDKFPLESTKAENAAERMKEISEAYSELKNAQPFQSKNNIRHKTFNWGNSSFNSRQNFNRPSFRKSSNSFGTEFDTFDNSESIKEIFETLNKKRNTDLSHLFQIAKDGFEEKFGKKIEFENLKHKEEFDYS